METLVDKQFDQIVASFEAELTTTYLYFRNFHGALQVAMNRSGISRAHLNEEIIQAFKQALCNIYYGGCEPEFGIQEAYQKWENFTLEKAFVLTTEDELRLFRFDTQNFYSKWKSPDEVNLSETGGLISPWKDKKRSFYVPAKGVYGDTGVDIDKFHAWKLNKTAQKFGI